MADHHAALVLAIVRLAALIGNRKSCCPGLAHDLFRA
jgi:hypothetical protein